MQKRTNPLELNVDAKMAKPVAESAAPEVVDTEELVDLVAKTDEVAVPQPTSVKEEEDVVAAVFQTPSDDLMQNESAEQRSTEKQADSVESDKPIKAPVQKKKSASKKKVQPSVLESEQNETAAPTMQGAPQWQRVVVQKKEEPDTTDEQEQVEVDEPSVSAAALADETAVAQDTYHEPVVDFESQDVAVSEPVEEQQEDVPPPRECINDEQEALAVQDYEMSARFAFRGKISRGVKVGKISKDLCRLAQLMHPDQSLSTILENALLTRIYLENRDAFDAMAVMIEKKGGHIKC